MERWTPGSHSLVFIAGCVLGYSEARQRSARVNTPRLASSREYLRIAPLARLIYASLLTASLRQRQAAIYGPPHRHVARRVGWFFTPKIISHARLCSSSPDEWIGVGVVRLLSPTPLMPGLERERLRRRFSPYHHPRREQRPANYSHVFECPCAKSRLRNGVFLARVISVKGFPIGRSPLSCPQVVPGLYVSSKNVKYFLHMLGKWFTVLSIIARF